MCRYSPPPPQRWVPDLLFLASQSCGPTRWLPLLFIKTSDVDTNPGPTTTRKKIWICDICHSQIHCRKQISIRCNRAEHLVHLTCAGIRLAQFRNTWTFHLHKASRHPTHTNITPPHPSRSRSSPNTSPIPSVPTGLLKPNPNPLIH